jgi:hypothetical protein
LPAMRCKIQHMKNKRIKKWKGWMAVGPKFRQPWSVPWVYLRKTKPAEIEFSGFKAIRIEIRQIK